LLNAGMVRHSAMEARAPWMQNQLFEAALGIARPWYVRGVDFDPARKVLTIGIDFVAGSRFAAPGVGGVHPVHDTLTKRLRHLNFFQHECYLEVRTPRVKLPDGRVVQIEPDWFGKLSGFTLLFEALVLALAQQMTPAFAGAGSLPRSPGWSTSPGTACMPCVRAMSILPWLKPTSRRSVRWRSTRPLAGAATTI
jgi:transposase